MYDSTGIGPLRVVYIFPVIFEYYFYYHYWWDKVKPISLFLCCSTYKDLKRKPYRVVHTILILHYHVCFYVLFVTQTRYLQAIYAYNIMPLVVKISYSFIAFSLRRRRSWFSNISLSFVRTVKL